MQIKEIERDRAVGSDIFMVVFSGDYEGYHARQKCRRWPVHSGTSIDGTFY